MIRHNVTQGTEAWLALRLGIPTASCFSRVLTPKGLGLSDSSAPYAAELVAEWALGEQMDGESSGYMARGTESEKRAVAWYEAMYDVEVDRVGFCTTDDGTIGCSPDGLVGDGGLEIKTLSAKHHVAALLGKVKNDYRLQIQGGIFVCEKAWWDRLFWHPFLPSLVVRIEPEPDVQAALAEHLPAFVARVEAGKARLTELGFTRP